MGARPLKTSARRSTSRTTSLPARRNRSERKTSGAKKNDLQLKNPSHQIHSSPNFLSFLCISTRRGLSSGSLQVLKKVAEIIWLLHSFPSSYYESNWTPQAELFDSNNYDMCFFKMSAIHL